MKRSRTRIPLALLCGLLFATASLAQQALPRNDGWVTDGAGFLTAQQEQALEALMESYKVGSGHEIVLLTVPDLGGRSLERYALEVAREWGLGEKGRNNGALLLVAKAERKIRIEVGRGLEGNLTDSISGRIIRDVIGPEFKRGRFHEGLRGGIETMHAAAGGEYGQIARRSSRRRSGGGVGLLPLLFIGWFVISLIRRGGRGSRGGRGGAFFGGMLLASALSGRSRAGGFGGFSGGGGFGGFGGGGGFSGGGSSGGW